MKKKTKLLYYLLFILISCQENVDNGKINKIIN